MNDARPACLLLLATLVGIACASHAHAQQPQPRECGQAGPRQACEVLIDRTAPVSGRSVVVENGTRVTLVVQGKSPFESCGNEEKREQLPQAALVPQLLTLLQTVVGSLILPVGGTAAATRGATGPQPEALNRGLAWLKAEVLPKAAEAEALRRAYEAELRRLDLFYRAYGDATRRNDFEQERGARAGALATLERQLLPVCGGCEVVYKKLAADLADLAADPPQAHDLGELFANLSAARQSLDLLANATAAIQEVRTRLQPTLTYLESLKNAQWESRLPIHADRQAKITANVACTSDITGKRTLDPPIVVTVTFESTPLMNLAAGVLVSWVRRNRVAIEPVADVGSSPPTAHDEIREHPSQPQALPFTFLNVRLLKPVYWRGHRVTFNAAPGFGLNSNNGDVSTEFFLGGSIGIGSAFFAAGAHRGHEVAPANGFEVNTRPPDKLTKVPLATPWRTNVAFAVSYRIPLK